MKSVLISIKPEWVEKIASGEKTIEVRKTAPKKVPFKAYIYATRPKKYYKCGAISTSDELLWLANGKIEMGDGFKFWADGDEYQCLNGRIIGEFICDKVYKIEQIFSFYYCYSGYDDSSDFSYFEDYSIDSERLKKTCLTRQELYIYGKEKNLYGWHISDLKIYDKPKELSEFCIPCKVSCENCKNPLYFECWCEEKGKKIVTRPPQSWMYVEEVEQ